MLALIKGSSRFFYCRGIGIVLGVVDGDGGPVGQIEAVLHARHGHDDGLVELPLQPLLDDLQVQQSQKPAAEALAEGSGRILLVGEGCVVQLVFFKRIEQGLVVIRGDGIDGREDDGLHFLEAGQGFVDGVRRRG